MKKPKDYSYLDAMRLMPPLYNVLPDHDFDFDESEVIRFILDHPALLRKAAQKIFNAAVNHKAIKYDKKTGKWYGVLYGEVKK